MSLSGRERQALSAIEGRLAGSDPRLAAMLATFTQLTAGEDMPPREKIRSGRRPARRPHRRGRARRLKRISRPARTAYQRLGRQRTLLLVWLVTAITLIAVAVALSRSSGSGGTYLPAWALGCAGECLYRPGPAVPGRRQRVPVRPRGCWPGGRGGA